MARRLLRDIEANAQHLTSGDIAQLLTFYSDLTLETDSLGGQYIPLTAAKTYTPKLFAVGIIPPQVAVTGRALDRSASVASQGDPLPVLPNSSGGPTLNIDGSIADATVDGGTTTGTQEFDPTKNRINTKAWQSHPDSFWIDFVSMAERQGTDPMELAAVLWNESNFDPGAYNASGRAKGLIQLVPVSAFSKRVGMDRETWEGYQDLSAEDQLVYVERYLNGQIRGKDRGQIYRVIFGGFNNPDGSLYASAEYQKQFSVEFPRAEYQATAYKINAPLDKDKDGTITVADLRAKVENLPPFGVRAKIEQAENSGIRSGRRTGTEGDAATEDTSVWATDGSALNDDLRRQFDAIAGTGYNATEFGQKLQLAQRKQIEGLQAQIEKMKKLPPLKMLVNPNSFAVAHTKVVADANWSRTGPIVEHWGEEQDAISASGQLAGFYAVDGVSGNGGPGLTRMARQFSQSYQNFMALYLLYRSNAGVYMEDQTGVTPSEKRVNLALLGSVYIFYDNILYIGSFENFNITETDEKPFTLEYNFSFRVRASFLLDEPTDQRFTYGAPGLFVNEATPTLPSQQRVDALEGDLEELQRLREEQIVANNVELFGSEEATTRYLELEMKDAITSSPKTPGNEAGAEAERKAREQRRARAQQKFINGEYSLGQRDSIYAANPLD